MTKEHEGYQDPEKKKHIRKLLFHYQRDYLPLKKSVHLHLFRNVENI